MTSKLHPPVLRNVAAALVLGTLALGCQAEGSSSSSTPTAAQHPQHPTATAAAAMKTQRASHVPAGPGPFASDATDRRLATTIAASIQRAFTPPPGSRKLSGPPQGTWRDLQVPGGTNQPGLLVVSSWWKVPGQPQAVVKWLLAHEPRPWSGFGLHSIGPVGEPGDVRPAGHRPADVYEEWSDLFENPHEPAVIVLAQLLVEEIKNGSGQVYTRVDSRVIWSLPRSLAERVPASAKVVTITAEPTGGAAVPRDSPATVTNPATVARIAALINGLYRTEGLCDMAPPLAYRFKLTFNATAGGPPLATAVADVDSCAQMQFSIPRVSTIMLDEASDKLVPNILAAAGLHWPT